MRSRAVKRPPKKNYASEITVVLMTNPSRGSAFYFRHKDGEYYDRAFNRCRDILTWTHYDEINCENVSHFADAHAPPARKSGVEVYPIG